MATSKRAVSGWPTKFDWFHIVGPATENELSAKRLFMFVIQRSPDAIHISVDRRTDYGAVPLKIRHIKVYSLYVIRASTGSQWQRTRWSATWYISNKTCCTVLYTLQPLTSRYTGVGTETVTVFLTGRDRRVHKTSDSFVVDVFPNLPNTSQVVVANLRTGTRLAFKGHLLIYI